ncbi:MAG: C25 family cysteine peptidase [candidate division WOR-3 bacterium]
MKRFLILFLFLWAYSQEGARYLIISHENFIPAITPLAEWKIKKGLPTKIVPLSVTGRTPDSIRNYILNAYNTWPIKPEYILLVGSGNYLRSYNSRYDDYYGNMTGDYKEELSVGRFSCNTPRQCSVMVLKSITYEKNPYLSGDSSWFLKGTTVVREDNPPDPYYQADARYIRNLVLSYGFIQTDSFINLQGHNANNVIAAVNEGRSFVVYRGQGVSNWWSPFACNPDLCRNLNKLPIIISATCQTMTFAANESMVCEGWQRKGKPDSLTGALAVFGSTNTGSGVSLYRGVVSKALFDAFFFHRIHALGDALKRAKFYLDSLYHNQVRYQEWNLLGDPELPFYTKKPERLEVVWDSVILLGSQNYRVFVQNLVEEESALVCFRMDSTVYAYGYTHYGQIELPINPIHPGSFELTVTCPNYLPFEGEGRVSVGNRPYLIFSRLSLSDRGNHNGRVNPGEEVGLFLTIKNIGGSAANNVRGVLRSSDRFVSILDSVKNFGSIAPGESALGGEYLFSCSPACSSNHNLGFLLRLYSDEDSSYSTFAIRVYAGRLTLLSTQVIDSFPLGNNNGRIGRSEGIRFRIKLKNSGSEELNNCLVKIRAYARYLSLTDSLSQFGTIFSQESLSNFNDELSLTTSPSLPPGEDLLFKFFLSGSGQTYQFLDSFSQTFRSEGEASSLPQGPCPYGYFAYDNTDTASGEAPVYNWFGIAPPGPGRLIPEISTHDAATVTLPLPFRFQYYGIFYDSISISSNGFLALGRTAYRFGNNSPIPDTIGPPAMLAPFWDDLNTNENQGGFGDVYEYYDTTNHRYLCEFNQVAHNQRPSVRETFQVILLDPNYYPTPTGDGEIIYQYAVVADALSNTVGIEDHTEARGLQYLYNNNYSPNSAPLTSGRAIKFSTKRPRHFNQPFLSFYRIALNDSLGNGNGLPEPGEEIKLTTEVINLGDTDAISVSGILRSRDEGEVRDSFSFFGNIPVGGIRNNLNPFTFFIPEVLEDSLLHFYLSLSASGYSSLLPFEIPVSFPTGVADLPNFLLNHKLSLPTILRKGSALKFSLKEGERLEMLLYDITGRKIKKISLERGERQIVLPELPVGIYFLKMKFENWELKKKFIYLK